MFDLIIRGGQVALPSGVVVADIGVRDGKIAVFGDLTADQAREDIKASGKLVLPGFIDPHVHLNDVDTDVDMYAVDDFYTGTMAASFGGNTTVIDFALPVVGDSAVDTINARRADADGEVAIDYSLHVPIESNSPTSRASIAMLPEHGINSVKLFMMRGGMADDYAFNNIINVATEHDLLVLIHAENAAMLTGSRKALLDAKRLTVKDFPEAHPSIAEIEAVQRAILLAERAGATLYVVHIAAGPVVDLIRQAQMRGVRVIGETVTHYLTLTDEVYRQSDGAKFVCGPPIRSIQDQQALWQGIEDGTINLVGSDHCGFSAAQKGAHEDDFRKIPKGVNGIETRATAIFSEGVAKGRISLRRFIDLVALNPAQVFGIYPQKGVLALGSDADICIFDPTLEWKMTPEALHVDWGYSLHDNTIMTGKPVMTILRGQIITDGDRFLGQRGGGKFIKRNRPAMPAIALKESTGIDTYAS